MKWTKIFYYEAGEDMKATEWITITDDPIIMRCSPKRVHPDGIVAYSACENSYIAGDRVPVYLIIKEEDPKLRITCPKCDGKGYIYEND